MKKKAFKEILKYVRVIVFFAVITILVEAVNYVMVQPGYARYIIHTVDNRRWWNWCSNTYKLNSIVLTILNYLLKIFLHLRIKIIICPW